MEREVGCFMIRIIADNIISPLGFSTDENFESVMRCESKIKLHKGIFDLPEDFCGSLFDRDELREIFHNEIGTSKDLSFMESISIMSVLKAVKSAGVDPSGKDVIFVISSTKGNVEYLSSDLKDKRCYLASSGNKITDFFGNKVTPIIVSNACISGVCAQIAGVRQLLTGKYKYAIIVGCDVLSKFIISGFQSFKALSSKPCKPFDKNRCGLNLGEAAGTIILERTDIIDEDSWYFVAGSIHNDANHISGPSRTGEGSFRVLTDLLRNVDKNSLAFINVHGTSTLYNDEMESIALTRAGLEDIPVSALKGFYGHTLGAAGIIETILSVKAADRGCVLPVRGYSEQGTTCKLNVSELIKPTTGRSFIKILSGFGGTNAGIAYKKGGMK